ncbi:phosphoribosylamine--glycine ligase [soil metagenome]
MRILLIGSGGREHALAWRLKKSASVTDVFCPNGNPGIAKVARAPLEKVDGVADWIAIARREKSDLVVVGPEGPLEEGFADAFAKEGIAVFGPVKAGARLEFSKAFAKEIMAKAGVATALAESFDDAEKAKDFAKSLGLPAVIKADGLAAGKGVTIAETRAEAAQAIDENLLGARFGRASGRILIEEFMEGEEASVFGLCDGENIVTLAAAQDHKRVLDGDRGPNTGGMGAYAPAPIVTEEICAAVERDVMRPVLAQLRAEGIVYRGVLYAGLMLTKSGVKVVEFNCRFGDPETQVVLPILEGDFGELLMACATGNLKSYALAPQSPLSATTVVIASGGYPGEFEKGIPINGLDACDDFENGMVFHAGTALGAGGRVVTAGGRVLSCTAWDRTLARSRDRAYELASRISFPGMHFRKDIAHRALTAKG